MWTKPDSQPLNMAVDAASPRPHERTHQALCRHPHIRPSSQLRAASNPSNPYHGTSTQAAGQAHLSTVGMAMGMPPTTMTSRLVSVGHPSAQPPHVIRAHGHDRGSRRPAGCSCRWCHGVAQVSPEGSRKMPGGEASCGVQEIVPHSQSNVGLCSPSVCFHYL